MCLSTGDPHVTITHDPLDPTLQGPLALTPAPWISNMVPLDIRYGTPIPRPRTSGMGPPVSTLAPPLVISGGHHWRPVQTCSLEDQLLIPTGTGMLSFSLKPSTN